MVKHSQAIRQQFAKELFECVWPFCALSSLQKMHENWSSLVTEINKPKIPSVHQIVTHILKILQQMLQDFQHMFDHFVGNTRGSVKKSTYQIFF